VLDDDNRGPAPVPALASVQRATGAVATVGSQLQHSVTRLARETSVARVLSASMKLDLGR